MDNNNRSFGFSYELRIVDNTHEWWSREYGTEQTSKKKKHSHWTEPIFVFIYAVNVSASVSVSVYEDRVERMK